MLCQIFRSGKHTDSNGNTRDWTNDDLDKICYQFKNVHSTVPVCVGHPQTNSPAYGWLKDVQRIGDKLYCDFKGVQKEFKQAVQKGLFKNRSISLDKDLNIRHLAFLGGQAPAIKGLEEFCFTADQQNSQVYEFSDFQDMEVEMEENQLQKELEAKNEEISRLQSELAAQKREQKIKEFEDFAHSAIEKGNILPAHKESIVSILSACDKSEPFNFSDGSTKSGVQVAKDFISSLKCVDVSGEIASGEQAGKKTEFSDAESVSIELNKIITEQNVDLVTAFSKLQSKGVQNGRNN